LYGSTLELNNLTTEWENIHKVVEVTSIEHKVCKKDKSALLEK